MQFRGGRAGSSIRQLSGTVRIHMEASSSARLPGYSASSRFCLHTVPSSIKCSAGVRLYASCVNIKPNQSKPKVLTRFKTRTQAPLWATHGTATVPPSTAPHESVASDGGSTSASVISNNKLQRHHWSLVRRVSRDKTRNFCTYNYTSPIVRMRSRRRGPQNAQEFVATTQCYHHRRSSPNGSASHASPTSGRICKRTRTCTSHVYV